MASLVYHPQCSIIVWFLCGTHHQLVSLLLTIVQHYCMSIELLTVTVTLSIAIFVVRMEPLKYRIGSYAPIYRIHGVITADNTLCIWLLKQ